MDAALKEEAILEKIHDTYLSPSIKLTDLIRIHLKMSPRYEIGCIYLSALSKDAQVSYMLSALSSSFTRKIIFLPDWTVVLCSSSVLVLSLESKSPPYSRDFMKAISTVTSYEEFIIPSGPAILGLAKMWVKFQDDLIFLLNKLDFQAIAAETQRELEELVYSRSKMPVSSMVSLIFGAKKSLNLGKEINFYIKEHAMLQKPLVEKKVIGMHKVEIDSFSYSNSEGIENMEELSFNVSEAYKDRFPRFSEASITVTDTPAKEIRKSFLDYIELIESSKASPIKHSTLTPLGSPKQYVHSINQVKEKLHSQFFDKEEQESPIKPYKTQENKKYREGEDENIRSLQTELTGSSELEKQRIVFDSKNNSCKCGYCIIM